MLKWDNIGFYKIIEQILIETNTNPVHEFMDNVVI